MLDKYRPALLVVENEENSVLFYTGRPEQYGAELKAPCQISHQKGILCTNGGLVGTLVALREIQEQVNKGKALLSAYRTSGIDYVNFHSYFADPQALEEAVEFLKAKTGRQLLPTRLVNLEGSLRPTGEAFQHFIQQNFK